jgi:hypothetical protein
MCDQSVTRSRDPSSCLGNLSWFPGRVSGLRKSIEGGFTIWVHSDGPVDEIEVYIIETQTLQTLVECLLHSGVVSAP